MMNIRPVTENDFPALIQLFTLNTPRFFGLNEIAEFEKYLGELELTASENYFVMEENGNILGAAGFYIHTEENISAITWIFFHPTMQGKGLGKMMVNFLINKITSTGTTSRIRVRTSQMAFRFFELLRFQLTKIENDFWAPGLHLYEMWLQL